MMARAPAIADYSCMPQGTRTALEQTEFKVQLPNINLLFLGCEVLVLLDLIYLQRFWCAQGPPASQFGQTAHSLMPVTRTQFEAHLPLPCPSMPMAMTKFEAYLPLPCPSMPFNTLSCLFMLFHALPCPDQDPIRGVPVPS